MRKISTLIVFLGLITVAQAQTINTFPYTHDFNNNWAAQLFPGCATGQPVPAGVPFIQGVNGIEDQRDWISLSGPTGSFQTGPTANSGADCDNNAGAIGAYVYVETSGCANLDEAHLMTADIDASSAQVAISFCYHMYGSNMGTLHGDVSTDGGMTWTLDVFPSTTGNQDVWQNATVSLAAFPQSAQTRFRWRYIDDSGNTCCAADCAIDNVEIVQLFPDNAGVCEIIQPALPVCALSGPVQAVIQNNGTQPMGSVNIDLNIGGTITSLPISYPATDSLMPGAKDTITIDTAATWAIGNLIIVTTSMPNGVVDPDPSDDNDTVSVAALGLSGTFTLDPTGSGPTNFVSFNDAVNNLMQFGVCGPVTINVATGVYQEQIDIPEILGMSMTNTVTFQAATLDSSDATINYTPVGTLDNFTVRLNGASHFRFRHMTMSSDGNFNNRVVELSGTSEDNRFMNNHIFNTVNVSSTSNFRAVIYSNIGTINNNIRIENNLIENGSYGIWLQGGGIGTEETGNVISNNAFIDFYFNGVYGQYQDEMVFEHNFMETQSPYTFTGYGARFLNTTGGLSIMNNTVSQNGTATGQPLFGIQCSSCFGTNLDRIVVANNSIHVGEPNVTNVVSGIEWTTSGPADIYNNSVNVEGNNNLTRALRAQGGGGNFIFNNVLANTGQQGVSIWYADPFAVSQSNYNDLWSVTGDLASFGGNFILPTPETTLAAWQANTAFDLNSISADPLFAGPNDLHACADELDQAASPMFGLGLDFDGEPRDQVAPDIGADEFLGLANFAAGSDTIVCAQELVLNVTGAQSVLWSTGETNPIITVTTPQNPLIVSVVTSCGAASDTFAVTFAPLPNLQSDVHLCADEQVVLDPGVPNSMYSWSTGSTGQSIVVTSDDPGTYIVDINDTASGCVTSDTTVITASEGVDLGDDQTLCTPNTLTLDASISGGAVYVWSTNEFTSSITVSQSGTYSVSVTDSASCISVDEVVVDVAEAPDASFFTTVNFLTGIFTNTSTLFGNNTYLWDFGDGNSSTDENPTHVYAFPAGGSGDFVVTLTVSNECGSSTFTDTVSIGVTVGIEDLLAGESGIAVFPNPNNGNFRIALQTNGSQEVRFDVLDLQGRVVYNKSFGNVNGRMIEDLTLTDLATGTYMVKVTMDDHVHVERLVIE